MEVCDCAFQVREADSNVPIALISQSNDYAMQCYLVGACYFVLKPINEDSCAKLLSHIIKSANHQEWELEFSEHFKCKLKEICTIEWTDSYCILHFINGEKLLNREEMTVSLDAYDTLYQCHDGLIVNLAQIKHIGEASLNMQNGQTILLSREQTQALQQYYMRCKRKCTR